MKNLIVVLAVAFSGVVFSQTNDFLLRKVFYDSISNDSFLNTQKYASFTCTGFIFSPDHPVNIDVTLWLYKQNFNEYTDTSKYIIVYDSVSYDTGFHYEYFEIFDKTSLVKIRQLMASYELHSNRLVGIMDSNLDEWAYDRLNKK
jgi:hypothetical protein